MPISVWLVGLHREEVAACHRSLRASGCAVAALESLHDARAALSRIVPDVMVMPIRLGDFNGIHLALIAQTTIPKAPLTIVVDQPDGRFFREVCEMGSYHLVRPIVGEEVSGLVRRITAGPTNQRRATRIPVGPGAPASLNGTEHARVIEFSDTGMRLELPATTPTQMPAVFKVAVADHHVTVRSVWQRPSGDGIHCGLVVDPQDPADARQWHQLRQYLTKRPRQH